MTNKQNSLDNLYMQVAKEHAKLSKAVRLKVGSVIVTKSQVMLGGYNGQPPGYPNECETVVGDTLVTKHSTLHAEVNSILKAAREGVSLDGSTLYVSVEPCAACCAMIKASGITRVVFEQKYSSASSGTGGIEELADAGVLVESLPLLNQMNKL